MPRIRMVGVCLALACATAAMAASTASAAPEFLHNTPPVGPLGMTEFTGKSAGAVTVADPALGSVVKCSKEEITGEIEPGSTTHVEEVVVRFKGCYAVITSSTGAKVKCHVNSPGQPNGSVKTKRLEGDLGEVLAAEAASTVGLDLKPEIGTVLTVIVATGCKVPNASVEGSIIGEMQPIGPPETKEKKLVSATAAGKQMIQHFVGEPIDTLSIAATEVTLTSTVTLKFLETVEVT
jgi:hypothetical protein